MSREEVYAAVLAVSDMTERMKRPASQLNGYDRLLAEWAAAFLPLIDHCLEATQP